MPLELVTPKTPPGWAEARRLIEEYAASLGVDLCFQDLAGELEHLEEQYGPPHGHFLLALRGSAAVGCVGLRRFAEGAAEMKRLYVVDAERGRGTGRALVAEIVAAARHLGYARLLLDTLPSMRAAQQLYLAFGFRPIPPYRHNPIAGAAYLELALGPASG